MKLNKIAVALRQHKTKTSGHKGQSKIYTNHLFNQGRLQRI